MVEHTVSPEEFVIPVNYDKRLFEQKVQEFICDIIKEAQNNDLYRYHWTVHRPFCEDIETPDSYFLHSAIITFTGL